MIEYYGEVEYEVRPYHLTRAHKEGRKRKIGKIIIAPELKKLDETIFSRRGGGLSKIRRMPPDRHTRLSLFILKAFE